MHIEAKYEKLQNIINDMRSVAIAFSGGVDSTLLLKVARDILGDRIIAITITSPFHPNWEIKESKKLADVIGAHQVFLPVDMVEEIRMNPPNRCYICKKHLFQKISYYASQNNYKYIADGSNKDDISDYRPGMKALEELGIRSPLLEAGIGKEEIRILSKKLGLTTWNKPAHACLLTRIPYGQLIQTEDLEKIQAAEYELMEMGFKQLRVRVHDNLARIELENDEIPKVFANRQHETIHQKLKALGFAYITLDLEGYKMGKFNREIKGRGRDEER